MSRRKKKCNPVSRKKISKRSAINKPIDDSPTDFSFDMWKSQLPHWLIKARAALLSGQKEEIAEILSPERIEQVLKGKPEPVKIVVIYGIARLLRAIGQLKRAESLCENLLKLQPDNYAIYKEMGILFREQDNINEAVKYFTKAKELNPDDPKTLAHLGTNLMRLGQTERGMELIRQAVEKEPDNNNIWTNFFFYMHYLHDFNKKTVFNKKAVFEKTKLWAETNFPPRLAKQSHENYPDRHRRLKIGYISPDFRRHSVNYFFEPLLDGHNREIVEVYGYGNVKTPDDKTAQLVKKFDHYRDIYRLNDKEVANLIERDCIDILVDLAGHTGDTRIYAMAYKPAPIQVTWLGYPDTTGMSQIDYRLTDSIADPPCEQEFYTEELFYLPDGFLCYEPCNITSPLSPLPAIRNGYITFGSFNNSSKINPYVIELWSQILKATPGSKLLLKFRSGHNNEVREMFVKRFEEFGISPERIAISGWLPEQAHLELYNHMDIALDTFPYNGTTTTCQAISMGVPTISLVGRHNMSRVGLSILTRLELDFFTASTPDEYVSKATALAAKPDALAEIRFSLRDRMAASSLCNRDLFAKNTEQAYRKMWQKWCKTKNQNNTRSDIKITNQDASGYPCNQI